MQRREYKPQPPLDQWIACVWTAERYFQAGDWFDITPDSFIELVFTFGEHCQIDDGQTVRDLPRCCVVGLLDKPLRLRADGLCRTVAARFWAWGFYPLLAGDLPKVSSGIQLRDLAAANATNNHDEWRSLTDRIEYAVQRDDGNAAVAHLHAFLLERAKRVQPDQTMLHAATRLLRYHGQIAIADLARRAFLSRRQLERKFSATVGMAPKALARRMRFEQARNQLYLNPSTDLAALAHTCGYADQAHCIREFKQFSNRTPRQFAAEMHAARALIGYVSPPDVANIQDE